MGDGDRTTKARTQPPNPAEHPCSPRRPNLGATAAPTYEQRTGVSEVPQACARACSCASAAGADGNVSAPRHAAHRIDGRHRHLVRGDESLG